MLNSSGNPLRVALLSISPHNRAILEFFFAGAGKQLFRLASVDDAEVLIIDFDHPGAESEWQQHLTASRPGIMLSVREINIPNTIWVPKPLTSQTLVQAASQIKALLPRKEQADDKSMPAPPPLPTRQAERGGQPTPMAQPFGVSNEMRKQRPAVLPKLADEDDTSELAPPSPMVKRSTPTPEVSQKTSPSSPPAKDTKTDGGFLTFDEINTPEKNQEQIEQRWKRLCGEHEDLDSASWQDSMLRYTPENYLLKNFNDALKLARQSGQTVQLKIDANTQVLLMPAAHLAYSSMDIESDSFAELCNTPMQPGRVQLHVPSATESAVLEAKVQQNMDHIHDMESMVWTISLLTAHGRINRDTDANQRLILKHWPNLTRMEDIPHVMRIAAVWHQRPGNLFEIARWLEIPQRYVFAFYGAANALGLLAVDEGKAQHKEKEAPKKNRGLFSRLLKRLLGGGAK